MKISKIHQRFANYLNNQEALTNPEPFLGPNYKTVLNFWIYIDKLNDDQWNVVEERYYALTDKEGYAASYAARKAARNAANDVVGDKARYAAWNAAWCSTPGFVDAYATYELISMHLLLDSGKTLKFIPLF